MAPVLKSGLHSPNGGLARHPLAGSSSSLSALVAEYTTLSVLTRNVLFERLRKGRSRALWLAFHAGCC